MFPFQALQQGLALAQRAQFLDLPAQPDELLAIDARFLQLAENLRVGRLYGLPALFPRRLHRSNALLGPGDGRCKLLDGLLQIRLQRDKHLVQAGENVLSGEVFERSRRYEGAIEGKLAAQGV